MSKSDLVERIARAIRLAPGHGDTIAAEAVIADLKLYPAFTWLEEGRAMTYHEGPPTHWRIESRA